MHGEKAGGQASCEFLAEYGEPLPPDGKTQVLPEKSPDAPQNVGVSDNSDDGLRKTAEAFGSKNDETERGAERDLHEDKSEIAGTMHETKSESAPKSGESLHESTSEYAETLHESKSEVTETLHETTSELAERVARELLDGLRRAAWVR